MESQIAYRYALSSRNLLDLRGSELIRVSVSLATMNSHEFRHFALKTRGNSQINNEFILVVDLLVSNSRFRLKTPVSSGYSAHI